MRLLRPAEERAGLAMTGRGSEECAGLLRNIILVSYITNSDLFHCGVSRNDGMGDPQMTQMDADDMDGVD
jgi:hypothetical protein